MTPTQPPGYFAAPPAGQGPAVLVLHPWWGLNDTIRAVVLFYGTGPADFNAAAAAYLGHFGEAGEYDPVELPDGRFMSTFLPGFWLDVAWLRQDPLPSYREALTAIFRSSDAFPPDLRAL